MKTAIIVVSLALPLLAACAPVPATPLALAPTRVAATPAEQLALPTQAPSVAPTQPPTAVPAPTLTSTATLAATATTPATGQAQPAVTRPAGSPAAAGSGATPAVSPGPTPAMSLPPDLPAAQVPMWLAWQNGPHADTYGLEKGPNTYCARCHAPANYDVQSKVDPPPNCVSCKFPTDPQVRLAQHNRFVQQADWKSIGCDVCHQVEPTGAVMQGIAWRDPATGQYQPVTSASELCSKCHADTETLRHQRDLGQSAHKDFTCVSCHNAHSMEASCTAANCHAAVAPRNATTPGHDVKHAKVECVACHDAAQMQIGRVKDTGAMTTWRSTELLGRKTTEQYKSHNVQRQVDCARCHFPGNGFGLPESVKAQS